jgi:hypothetical protein
MLESKVRILSHSEGRVLSAQFPEDLSVGTINVIYGLAVSSGDDVVPF